MDWKEEPKAIKKALQENGFTVVHSKDMIYIAPDLTDLRHQILKLVRPDLLKKELELERMENDAEIRSLENRNNRGH